MTTCWFCPEGKRPAVLGGSSSEEQILTGSTNIQTIGLIQSYGSKNIWKSQKLSERTIHFLLVLS